jgi:hypothetical protein
MFGDFEGLRPLTFGGDVQVDVVGEIELGVDAARNRPGRDLEDVTTVFLLLIEYSPLGFLCLKVGAVVVGNAICHNLGITPMKVGECKAIVISWRKAIALSCLSG